MFDTATPPTTAQMCATVAAWAAAQGGRPAGDPAAEVVDIFAAVDRMTGVGLARLAEVDRSGLAVDRGLLLSTGVWLSAKTGMSPGTARRRVRTARILDQVLPQTTDELQSGTLSADQAEKICDAVGLSQVTRTVAAADEPALLEIVRQTPVGDLPRVMKHWRYVVDPAGGQDSEQRAFDRRELFVSSTFQDMVAVNGILDPVGGAAFLTAIGALSGLAAADDDRSDAQRRADALTQLCRQALDSRDLPEVAGERPHVTVTVDLATLTGQSTEPADLAGAGALSGPAARQIACDAGIVRILTRGPSEILDVGRRTRLVGPALRRALNVRDQGCVFDLCRRPTAWCDAHHLQHWADGGPTNLDNLALLCSQHHRVIHQQGWTLTLNPGGGWTTHPPPDRPDANPWTSSHRHRWGRRRRTA